MRGGSQRPESRPSVAGLRMLTHANSVLPPRRRPRVTQYKGIELKTLLCIKRSDCQTPAQSPDRGAAECCVFCGEVLVLFFFCVCVVCGVWCDALPCTPWSTNGLPDLARLHQGPSLSLVIAETLHAFLLFFSPLQESGLFLGEGLGLRSPAHHPEDPSCPSAKAGAGGEPGEELDLSFLPDDLSTPVHSAGSPTSP